MSTAWSQTRHPRLFLQRNRRSENVLKISKSSPIPTNFNILLLSKNSEFTGRNKKITPHRSILDTHYYGVLILKNATALVCSTVASIHLLFILTHQTQLKTDLYIYSIGGIGGSILENKPLSSSTKFAFIHSAIPFLHTKLSVVNCPVATICDNVLISKGPVA